MSTAPESARTARPGGGRSRRPTRWDVGFLVSALVVLAGSLIPLSTTRWGLNIWGTYGMFFIGIGVVLPLVAAGLLLARSVPGPEGAVGGPRLGSLSAEQTAHVAAWLALSFFLVTFATTLDPILVIGLVGALGLVVTSPLRRLVEPLIEGAAARSATHPGTTPAGSPDADPSGDPVVVGSTDAHPDAGTRPGAMSRPDTEVSRDTDVTRETDGVLPDATTAEHHADQDPAEQDPAGDRGGAGQAPAGVGPGDTAEQTAARQDADQQTDSDQIGRAPAEAQPAPRGTEEAEYEAFWFAVGSHRSAVDGEGTPLFELEPGGWILALEDRGGEFLVQNTDGRTGLLRDLTDIERA